MKPLALLLCAAAFGSCSTTGIRVPVREPARVNLVQYERIAVDRFRGDGCDPLADQLAAALRDTPNPTTGKTSFQVLRRQDIELRGGLPLLKLRVSDWFWRQVYRMRSLPRRLRDRFRPTDEIPF